jgi:hypothetical protein
VYKQRDDLELTGKACVTNFIEPSVLSAVSPIKHIMKSMGVAAFFGLNVEA